MKQRRMGNANHGSAVVLHQAGECLRESVNAVAPPKSARRHVVERTNWNIKMFAGPSPEEVEGRQGQATPPVAECRQVSNADDGGRQAAVTTRREYRHAATGVRSPVRLGGGRLRRNQRWRSPPCPCSAECSNHSVIRARSDHMRCPGTSGSRYAAC